MSRQLKEECQEIFKTSVEEFFEMINSLADYIPSENGIPSSLTLQEIAAEDLTNVFVKIMKNVHDQDIPKDTFLCLIRKHLGEHISSESSNDTLSRMLDIERKSVATTYIPNFLELLKKSDFETEHINNLADLWISLTEEIVKQSYSNSALAAQQIARSVKEDFEIYHGGWKAQKEYIKQDPSQKYPVALYTKQSEYEAQQDAEDSHIIPESKREELSKCKAKVLLAEDIDSIEEEMQRLIGMKDAKEQIASIKSRVKHDRILREVGLAPKRDQGLLEHYVFKGNPGTGKTTFARLVGKLYKEAGLLEFGHVIETDRADLVGEHIGKTEKNVREIIDLAKGGVLFVDEAYSLHTGAESGNDFGPLALSTILKGMETNKHALVVILAGYPEEMDRLVKSNPGLSSRFKYSMDFQDFSEDELMQIFDIRLNEINMTISPEAREKTKQMLVDSKARDPKNFGNARTIENTVDLLKDNLAMRLETEGTLSEIFERKINGDIRKKDLVSLTRIGVQEYEALREKNKHTEKPEKYYGFDTRKKPSKSSEPDSVPMLQYGLT